MDEYLITNLYERNESIIEYLASQKEITFQSDADVQFKKTLIMSIASYFESEISSSIENLARSGSNNNEKIVAFIKNKGISRQYHSYFNWKEKNANAFFGLFGTEYANFCKVAVKENERLNEGIKAFLEIGKTRNELAHQNFATFPIEKTSAEYFELFMKAKMFVEFFKESLLKEEGQNPSS